MAKDKGGVHYGMGLIINVPYPEAEVIQVVQDVVQDGIIRGTKEYNKDQFVSGATTMDSTSVFPAWTEGGRVFYKVRLKALDPRNFKDSNDVGTLAVRYVVQPQGPKNSVIHINAIFVEDFRRASHASNGSVESAEYKDINDRLETIASMKAEAEEINREKQDQSSSRSQSEPVSAESVPSATAQPPASAPPVSAPAPAPTTVAADSPASTPPAQPRSAPVTAPTTVVLDSSTSSSPPPAVETLQDHVKDLRRQVERLVKSPGAPLKSAPFHSASTLQTLPSRTEVLVEVTTPYWLGVETHDGQHGWIERDQLELLP
jgi:hypothetical protein